MATFTGDQDPVTSRPAIQSGTIAPHMAFFFAINGGTGTASVIYHYMTARDTVLGRQVYWYSTIVDSMGSEYTEGNHANLTGVRQVKVKG